MDEDTGSLTNPKSWGALISEVGPQYSVIFALLAMLGYLAFQGVPALMGLTRAIQSNTDTVASAAIAQEHNQAIIVGNQGKEIDNGAAMIIQHGDMLNLLKDQQRILNDHELRLLGLEADERARSAHDILKRR